MRTKSIRSLAKCRRSRRPPLEYRVSHAFFFHLPTPSFAAKEHSHNKHQQQSTDSDETPTSIFLQPNLAQLAERTPFAMSRNRRPSPPSTPTSSSRSPTSDADEEKPGEERYCYNKKKYVGTAEFEVDQSGKK